MRPHRFVHPLLVAILLSVLLIAGCGSESESEQLTPGVVQGNLDQFSSARFRFTLDYNDGLFEYGSDDPISGLSILGSYAQPVVLTQPGAADDPAYGANVNVNVLQHPQPKTAYIAPLGTVWDILPMVVGEDSPPKRLSEGRTVVNGRKAGVLRFTARGCTLESYAFWRWDSWIEMVIWAKTPLWPKHRDQLRLAVQQLTVW